MRTERHLFAVLAIVLAGSASPARAASRDFAADGQTLSVSSPCAARVAIDPDPSLQGSIRVAATASNPEEIAQLAVEAGGTAAVVRRAEPERQCWKPAGASAWSPTLMLRIGVPARMPVSIDETGAADDAIGAVGGPLSADLSGAVTLRAASVASLRLDVSGAARIAIGTLQGPATVRSAGHATVRIGNATSPTLRVLMSGSGNLVVADGTVGSLLIENSGAADVSVGGTTGNATLSLSGIGGVRIARLTGALRKTVSGVATVSIGG